MGDTVMRTYVRRVSAKGQITLPAELRRRLGVRANDKVTIELEGETVRISRFAYTLESAYGSVRPIGEPEDFEAQSQEAKDEHAAKTVRKLARGEAHSGAAHR
jgi:AbrB family looped-hinge helix DNA binding protein